MAPSTDVRAPSAEIGRRRPTDSSRRMRKVGLVGPLLWLLLGACVPQAPKEVDEQAFVEALRTSDREALSRLVVEDRIPGTALRRATSRRCERLELLLELGVDARGFDGAAALAHTMSRERNRCTDILRQAGARLDVWNTSGRNLMTAAVTRGEQEQIDRLLAIGFPVDAKDRHGDNALLIAARTDELGLARRLLNHGADPDVTDRDGWTALSFAAHRGSLELATLLLAAGAAPDPESHLGWTPLQLAAQSRNRETALELLAAGAAPDASSAAGETALVWAARHGDRALVRALIAAGADPSRQVGGVSMARWASLAGHDDLGAELERSAAGGTP